MLAVGRTVRVSCVENDEEELALRCYRAPQTNGVELRWTVKRAWWEVGKFANELESLGAEVPQRLKSDGKRERSKRSWMKCCKKEETRADPADVEDLLNRAAAVEDLEEANSKLMEIDRVVSEFLELSSAAERSELGYEGKFIEGYLKKTAVFTRDERNISNTVVALQVVFFVAGMISSSVVDSFVEGACGVALVYLLALLDLYLTRPTEPNRSLVLPCILLPFIGFIVLAGYVAYRTCLKNRTRRWFVLREKYIAYYDSNYACHPRGVFLFDQRTRVQSSWNPYVLHISNVDRALSIHFQSFSEKSRWKDSLTRILGEGSHLSQEKQGFFSPMRRDVPVQWYSSAKFLYRDMFDAFNNAKHEILIAGWMISPELRLIREHEADQGFDPADSTLEKVLGAAVQRNVRVCVLLYRDVEIALPNNSRHAKDRLSKQGVQIIRHAAQDRALAAHNHLLGLRAGSTWWSHHEKVVVVDQRIAFVGGIDLAFGRYDDMNHVLVDVRSTIWPGKDFYNVRVKEFERLEDPLPDLVDRQKVGRMPWHDIHCCVGEDAARDVALHFISRWNRELHQLVSFRTSTKAKYGWLLPARFPEVEGLTNSLPYNCSKVQILRSIGPWSLSASVERSIMIRYLELIEEAKEFIYIENQFFNSMDIARSICARLERAVSERDERFRVIVLLPQWPAFEGLPFDNPSTKIVLHFQHLTMDFVLDSLRKLGISEKEISERIQFFGLRKVDFLHGVLISEQVYVHSKLMIVDDEHCIIGSANLNERSLRGDRDSEVCAFISDRQFVSDLRCGLFIEHLGLHKPTNCKGCRLCSIKRRTRDAMLPSAAHDEVKNPTSDLLSTTGSRNRDVLQELFPGMQPSDSITTIAEAKQLLEEERSRVLRAEIDVLQKARSVKGHIVSTPLKFLRKEKWMLPTFSEPSTFILPKDNFN